MLKLLLFSDLHYDEQATERLVQRSGSFDILVAAGDFASVRRNIEQCLRVLRRVANPVVLVPGNNESFEELKSACAGWSSAHVLHGSAATIAGVQYFGIGGGIPTTPFGSWSYDFSEHEAESILAPCPAGCVLVTHSPPWGAVDIDSSGRNLGSRAIRQTIESRQPQLVVCGHVHKSAGKTAKIGTSTVINAGPGGVEWTLGAN